MYQATRGYPSSVHPRWPSSVRPKHVFAGRASASAMSMSPEADMSKVLAGAVHSTWVVFCFLLPKKCPVKVPFGGFSKNFFV